MTTSVEAAIFRLLTASDAVTSIAPEQVARVLAVDDWRKALPHVRATAIELARAGRLVITRHGKAVDPDGFKGVYRLALPQAATTVGETG